MKDNDILKKEIPPTRNGEPYIQPFVNPVSPNRFVPAILAMALGSRKTVALGMMLFGSLWLVLLYHMASANYFVRRTLETEFVVFFTGGFLHFFLAAKRPWVVIASLITLPCIFVIGCLYYMFRLGGVLSSPELLVPVIFFSMVGLLVTVLFVAHRVGRKG